MAWRGLSPRLMVIASIVHFTVGMETSPGVKIHIGQRKVLHFSLHIGNYLRDLKKKKTLMPDATLEIPVQLSLG